MSVVAALPILQMTYLLHFSSELQRACTGLHWPSEMTPARPSWLLARTGPRTPKPSETSPVVADLPGHALQSPPGRGDYQTKQKEARRFRVGTGGCILYDT